MKYWGLRLVVTDDSINILSSVADVGRQLPLFGLDASSLAAVMVELGEPNWRGRQLTEALYRQRITDLSEITTLTKQLREKLSGVGWVVGRPRIVQIFRSADGTERYLVQGSGDAGQTVETVWMPEGDGGEAGDGSGLDAGSEDSDRISLAASRNRATICVSSQVGCAVNCQFCLTAKLGFRRNLSAGEIAGQVVSVLARHRV